MAPEWNVPLAAAVPGRLPPFRDERGTCAERMLYHHNGARIRPAPAILVPAPTAYPPANSTLRVTLIAKPGQVLGKNPRLGPRGATGSGLFGEFHGAETRFRGGRGLERDPFLPVAGTGGLRSRGQDFEGGEPPLPGGARGRGRAHSVEEVSS